jgi:hypothetical protein
MMGYRPKVTTVSEVDIEISHLVDAVGDQPDWSQALQISAGTQLSSATSGQSRFYIDTPVDFTFSSSYDPTEVTIESLSGTSPQDFRLTKTRKAYSGEVKTITQQITAAEKFKTIIINDTNVVGILSITDSANNIWYEVPFLGQDTVFVDDQNLGTDSGIVPYNLVLRKVPRRFVTRFTSAGELQIQFGAGITGQNDDILTPDPTNVGLGTSQGISRIDYA